VAQAWIFGGNGLLRTLVVALPGGRDAGWRGRLQRGVGTGSPTRSGWEGDFESALAFSREVEEIGYVRAR